MNIIEYYILLLFCYNKYTLISLSDTFVLIHINFLRKKNIKYEALINKFFNLLKVNSYISIYLYSVLFLINSVSNNVISE